jgi:transporter family-2 protein
VTALLYIFVAVAGALTSIEAGANAKLARSLGGPWWPAVFFSLISITLLGLGTMVFGSPFPTSGLRQAPWWAWLGGVIGAVYVLSMLTGPGRLGSGLFTGLTVTAAIISSIALDHYGLVGFERHTAGVGRLIGAALMVIGVVCVAIF